MANELDLRLSEEGLPCEDYTLIVIAGPNDLPEAVRERMNRHLEFCKYHGSRIFIQSAVGTPVTPVLEKAARIAVAKYNSPLIESKPL